MITALAPSSALSTSTFHQLVTVAHHRTDQAWTRIAGIPQVGLSPHAALGSLVAAQDLVKAAQQFGTAPQARNAAQLGASLLTRAHEALLPFAQNPTGVTMDQLRPSAALLEDAMAQLVQAARFDAGG